MNKTKESKTGNKKRFGDSKLGERKQKNYANQRRKIKKQKW